MSEDKIGPWSSDKYESFLALDTEPRLVQPYTPFGFGSPLATASVPLGGLMSALLGETGPQQIEAFVAKGWAERRAHPVYKALQRSPHYAAAWKAFQTAVNRSRSTKLREPTTPFRFLHEFVWHAQFGFEYADSNRRIPARIKPPSPGKLKYGATKSRRESAARHARDLIELLGQGIRLQEYSQNSALRTLLTALVKELEATQRKEYAGRGQVERAMLRGFAGSLIRNCDLRSPTILTHFAAMVGVKCEMKTAQRHCTREAQTWKREMAARLAKSLLDTDRKGANSP